MAVDKIAARTSEPIRPRGAAPASWIRHIRRLREISASGGEVSPRWLLVRGEALPLTGIEALVLRAGLNLAGEQPVRVCSAIVETARSGRAPQEIEVVRIADGLRRFLSQAEVPRDPERIAAWRSQQLEALGGK